ncbi:MAG: hypothetical protein U5L75_02375 [Candidatus Campbellbacteria bacterium]|nr:hypothetical protein [Candidatus Campbellbacteria bacterium]
MGHNIPHKDKLSGIKVIDYGSRNKDNIVCLTFREKGFSEEAVVHCEILLKRVYSFVHPDGPEPYTEKIPGTRQLLFSIPAEEDTGDVRWSEFKQAHFQKILDAYLFDLPVQRRFVRVEQAYV